MKRYKITLYKTAERQADGRIVELDHPKVFYAYLRVMDDQELADYEIPARFDSVPLDYEIERMQC